MVNGSGKTTEKIMAEKQPLFSSANFFCASAACFSGDLFPE
jgi:hypothetical protein